MKEVHISGPKLAHTIIIPKIKKRIQYLFLRRTSRGGHVYILVDSVQLRQFEQEFPQIKEEYEEFEREHGRQGTVGYTVQEMPTDPEKFFRKLREYIDLDYRITEKPQIEIAVNPARMGQFIGRKGYKIKAIQRHLGTAVKVYAGIAKKGPGYKYFTGYRDPTRAYSITEGYVAPWNI